MKAILISINPQWCDLILSGKKTIEIRKTRPNLNLPFKVYIYMTKHKNISPENYGGKIIGEFTCDDIYPIRVFENGSIQDYMCHSLERSCVPYDDIANYIGYDKIGYGWHISDLIIYDQPKSLDELTGLRSTKFGYEPTKIKRPPQSYMYVEDLDEVARLGKEKEHGK